MTYPFIHPSIHPSMAVKYKHAASVNGKRIKSEFIHFFIWPFIQSLNPRTRDIPRCSSCKHTSCVLLLPLVDGAKACTCKNTAHLGHCTSKTCLPSTVNTAQAILYKMWGITGHDHLQMATAKIAAGTVVGNDATDGAVASATHCTAEAA
mmetsp:Transcript_11486/g.31330  ORF Transcript_11486/g.31330 Transcript_11486/m.31330 type:complete len:150 (+) Transcript_11486:679-1128(+)